jgi:ornithine cyclodeaminase/alanine dehydrogenase
VQARVLFQAHRALFPAFESLCADVRPEAAKAFAEEIGGRAVPVREAAACEVVCVATPARSPVVMRADVSAGAHVNAMGADAPGKQEVDPAVLLDARVFVDDWEQATHSGEVNVPLHAGVLAREAIAGTLGGVIAGVTPPPEEGAVTLFDSTGLAVQDLALARLLYRIARERGVGIEVDLVGV